MSSRSQRKTHSVRFTTASGLTLAGTIDAPETRAPLGLAVFAHHFAGSRQSPAATRICKALAEGGILCLRFDFPGLGSSEGSFPESSLSQYTDIVVTAARWLRDTVSQEIAEELPVILIGHSLGGDAVIKAAADLDEVRGVVTIGAPFTPADTIMRSAAPRGSGSSTPSAEHSFSTEEQERKESPHYIVELGGYEIGISNSFVDDLRNTDLRLPLQELQCPLLILHSDADDIVPISDAELIFQSARYPKSLMDLHGCDHLLAQRGSARRASQLIELWFESL